MHPCSNPAGRTARASSRALSALVGVLCVVILALTAAPASAQSVLTAEAEKGKLDIGTRVVNDASASGGAAAKYDWTGTLRLTVTLPADADAITLRVRGDQCAGAPAYTMTVDSRPFGNDSVASTAWADRTFSEKMLAGRHNVEVRYTNDHSKPWPNSCDRNLYVDAVTFSAGGSVVAANPAVAAAPNPAVPAGFVHQSGTQLLDGANRPLRLRGVNLGGWLLWEGWIWGQGFDYTSESTMMANLANAVGPTAAEQFRSDVRNTYITDDDFRAMSAARHNVARVPINSRLLEDDARPFTYKQSGWDVLDRAVASAKRHNVYLVLDMHAAPCGQVYGFISDYVGPEYLWSTPSCRDRLVAMWRAIAARYANENIIAGYDLLNETMIGDQTLLALYKRLTVAVRQVDPNHTLIYEGNNLARTFDLFTAPLDANEMLSFHDYPWMNRNEDLAARMPAYDAAARRLNAPQWVGEFGQGTYDDVQRYVTTLDGNPLVAGWADWTWKQSAGFPSMQTIQHTAASQKLVDYMNNRSRPLPTPAQATQGMSDFISAIRFTSTLPNAKLREILRPTGVVPSASGAVVAPPVVAPAPAPVPAPAPAVAPARAAGTASAVAPLSAPSPAVSTAAAVATKATTRTAVTTKAAKAVSKKAAAKARAAAKAKAAKKKAAAKKRAAAKKKAAAKKRAASAPR